MADEAAAPGAIRGWLEDLGLGQHAEAFEAQEIDLEALADITEGDLKEMGIPIGPRRKILRAITGLSTPAPLPAPPREAERRQITVMFCDLVGSTALSEKLDPEDLRTLMQSYQKAAGGVIERYEGHVAQYLGDGLMTYFGWPQAHEDDAERAVRASLEIVEAVKAVDGAKAPLQVRIGIATGPVVVGETGAGDASVPKMAVGETPNLAARVQGLAGPDEVVIGPSTQRLVGNAFTADDLGEHSLKGIVEATRAWLITGFSGAEGRFEATRGIHLTPFVGRDAEVALLMEKWEQAKTDAEGQLVLLCGEPGIGKSRITQVLRERMAQEPHIQLRYQCSPYHTNSALHPVIEQLERAAGFERENGKKTKLEKLEALVGTDGNTPALFASLLSLEIPEDRYAPLNMSPQKQKEKTLQALCDGVSGLSERNPVLFILEDAHWIDPTSQEVLDLIVANIPDKRVLVVVTYRPEYEAPWPQSLNHVTELNLKRMGRSQALAMVLRVTGNKPLPDEVLDQIAAKTDGIPLFVEELTKTIIESGLVKEGEDAYELNGQLTDLAIPSTIQDSLMARLDRLAPVKDVAQIGACIGREFSRGLLAEVCHLDNDQLNDALQKLTESELIYQSTDGFIFKHALVQDSARGSLLRSRRQEIHALIANALEKTFSGTEMARPETLGNHWHGAGNHSKAAKYYMVAARASVEKASLVEAEQQIDLGLAEIEDVDDNGFQQIMGMSFHALRGHVLAQTKGFAADEVEESYLRAEEIGSSLPLMAESFPAKFGLGLFKFIRGRFGDFRHINRELRDISEQEGDDILNIAALLMSVFCETHTGNYDVASAELKEVEKVCTPALGMSSIATLGLDTYALLTIYKALLAALKGDLDQAQRNIALAVGYARQSANPYNLVQALAFSGTVSYFCGDARSALRDMDECITICAEQGLPHPEAIARSFRGWALAELGEYEAGLSDMELSINTFLAIGADHLWPWYAAMRADVQMAANDERPLEPSLGDAINALDRSGEDAFRPPVMISLARQLEQQGRQSGAINELQDAISLCRKQGAHLLELRAATSLARLWQSQGKSQEAHDLLAPVYGWFTEGFDTADLIEAKALLGELEAGR